MPDPTGGNSTPESFLVEGFDSIKGIDALPGRFGQLALNLVRDPRAVAVSWQRRKGSARNTLSRVLDWKKRQRQLERWRPALGQRFFTLRYEDLAAAPAATIQAVADRCGIPLPADLFVEPDHTVVD